MGHEAGSSRLSVMYRPLASLRANPRNARTHTKAQLRQIADSIRAFGFLNPIILDDEGVVLAGHARLAAASSAGLHSGRPAGIAVINLGSGVEGAANLGSADIVVWGLFVRCAEGIDHQAEILGRPRLCRPRAGRRNCAPRAGRWAIF